MPSLIDIRRRVKAVKSTQQITKAMKMVSSSKLRRAQERIVKSRPYAREMLRVFNNLATRTENTAHPLLNDDPEAGRTLLIVSTADREWRQLTTTSPARAVHIDSRRIRSREVRGADRRKGRTFSCAAGSMTKRAGVPEHQWAQPGDRADRGKESSSDIS